MQPNANPIGHNNPPNDAEILKETLRDKNSKPLEHAQQLIAAADRIPAEIADEETAGKAADFIKQVTGSVKNLEALRVAEKEPYLTLGRVVDGFFKTTTDALDGAKQKAKRPLDKWLIAKADKERREREEAARMQRQKAEEEALIAAAMAKAQQPSEANVMMDQAVATEVVAVKMEKAAEARPAELAKSRGESGALASLRTWWAGEITDIAILDLEVLRRHINPEALQKAVTSYVAAGGRSLAGANIYEKSETVVR